MHINKEQPPIESEINSFIKKVDFQLPIGYVEFMTGTNGAEINKGDNFLILWPLNELFSLNHEYAVKDFAPSFFLIGSDGAGNAFAIKKESGHIYSIPFIGMSDKEASFISSSFNKLLNMFQV